MWDCRNAVMNSRIMENSIFGKRLAMKLSARDKLMPGFEVMETSLFQPQPRKSGSRNWKSTSTTIKWEETSGRKAIHFRVLSVKSQNSIDMGIPGHPNPNTNPAKVIWEGDILISLGFWEWRSPKHGDAHITVTVPFTYVSSSQSESLQQARKKVRGDSNGRKLKKINILLLSMVNSDRVFKKRYFYLRV